MLVDELRVPVAPQQHAEIVEPGDDALSFTPLTRNIVSGILFLRTWFRNVSWRFCVRSAAIELPLLLFLLPGPRIR